MDFLQTNIYLYYLLQIFFTACKLLALTIVVVTGIYYLAAGKIYR